MIQLLPEPKMAEDFEKTTININAIYFCGEISDELRKLARERFWNYQDIKINEASEDNFKVTAVHALPDIEVEDDILYREQGYDLEIQEDHAVISYETRIGFINAVTSLKQLIWNESAGYVLPVCHITDYPSLPVRAIAQTFSWYPEAEDKNVISSGVEAFGWLWL